MKKVLSTVAIILLLQFCLQGQVNDTIEVGYGLPATLVVEDNVYKVIIGNNIEYTATYDGNTVSIMPIKQKTAPTTFLIKHGDKKFNHGIIVYKNVPSSTFYDLTSKGTNNKGQTNSVSEGAKNIERTTEGDPKAQNPENKMHGRLAKLMEEDQELVLGKTVDNLTVLVTNIRHDNDYTYFVVVFTNETATNYVIENTTIVYKENKKKGLFYEDKDNREDKFVRHWIGKKEISPYSSEKFGYVIPIFSTWKSGHLELVFEEKNGSRNININIKSRDMQSVKNF